MSIPVIQGCWGIYSRHPHEELNVVLRKHMLRKHGANASAVVSGT